MYAFGKILGKLVVSKMLGYHVKFAIFFEIFWEFWGFAGFLTKAKESVGVMCPWVMSW